MNQEVGFGREKGVAGKLKKDSESDKTRGMVDNSLFPSTLSCELFFSWPCRGSRVKLLVFVREYFDYIEIRVVLQLVQEKSDRVKLLVLFREHFDYIEEEDLTVEGIHRSDSILYRTDRRV